MPTPRHQVNVPQSLGASAPGSSHEGPSRSSHQLTCASHGLGREARGKDGGVANCPLELEETEFRACKGRPDPGGCLCFGFAALQRGVLAQPAHGPRAPTGEGGSLFWFGVFQVSLIRTHKSRELPPGWPWASLMINKS